MIAALEVFEKHWLGNGTEFVSGNNITIADLFAITEMEQTSEFNLIVICIWYLFYF